MGCRGLKWRTGRGELMRVLGLSVDEFLIFFGGVFFAILVF